ncbi:hypothetical protein N665_0334s0019 [Sinapis alba]|nr:hypothetical protein N665_0334s0019 [Sinapis alba]
MKHSRINCFRQSEVALGHTLCPVPKRTSLCPRIIYVESFLSQGIYLRFGMGFRFLCPSGAFGHEALMFGGSLDLCLHLSGCDLWNRC